MFVFFEEKMGVKIVMPRGDKGLNTALYKWM